MFTTRFGAGMYLIRIRILYVNHGRMRLGHVLLKSPFLNEGLRASRHCAGIVQVPEMFLDVVIHRVLTICNLVTMRTRILSGIVANIFGGLLDLVHLSGLGLVHPEPR